MGRYLVRAMKYAQGDEKVDVPATRTSIQILALPKRKCPRKGKVRPERFELPTFWSGVRRAAVAP
jgi:hypothetical protein